MTNAGSALGSVTRRAGSSCQNFASGGSPVKSPLVTHYLLAAGTGNIANSSTHRLLECPEQRGAIPHGAEG